MPQAVPIISAVASLVAAGASVAQAAKSAPKVPKPPQASQLPNVNTLRDKNRQSMITGGDFAAAGTLLDPVASAGNTLLGK